jgi:hypothetical protein
MLAVGGTAHRGAQNADVVGQSRRHDILKLECSETLLST